MHRRSRLLLVVPAATAMVFTGLSPALAGGGDDGHRHGNDVWIVDIDRVEIENDDEARVYFTYECDEDTDDLSAKAHVRQDDSRYATKHKEDVDDCEEGGDAQEDSVLVKRYDGDELDADEDAKVRVTLYEDDDEVDSESDRNVDVEADDNGNGNGHDKDNDKDNGHH
jgi:hypothetical protein